MVITGNSFVQQDKALIARVLDRTWKVLENSGVKTFDDAIKLTRGPYTSCEEESGGRAFSIEHDILPEERYGGRAEPPSCRIQHGAILPSSTGTRLYILNIVDLNWSEYRTELWLPWLHCSPKIVTEGGFEPSQRGGFQGSLYVTNSATRLRDIIGRLQYVEKYIDPQSAGRNDSSSLVEVFLRESKGGESSPRCVVNPGSKDCDIVSSVRPWTGKFRVLNSREEYEEYRRIAPTQKQKLASAS